MRPQYWGVPGEVVKVVHDDSDEQVKHEEAAEEDEGDEEDKGDVGAAGLVWIQKSPCRHVSLDGAGVALTPLGTVGIVQSSAVYLGELHFDGSHRITY